MGMERKMLCFQCDQAIGGKRCSDAEGVCGKRADVAGLQEKLIGALIGLARAEDGNTQPNDHTYRLMIKGLLTDISSANHDEGAVQALIDEIHEEKQRLVPDCAVCASPCGRNNDYDVADIYNAEEDVRSLKSLILFGIKSTAALINNVFGSPNKTINELIAKALFVIGDYWSTANLMAVVQEIVEINLKCMEKIDNNGTVSYDDLSQGTVPLMVEEGSYISPNVRDDLVKSRSVIPVSSSSENMNAIQG